MTEKEKIRGPGWTGYSGPEHPTSKSVVQYDKQGKRLRTWGNIQLAAKNLHIEQSNIVKAIRGKRKSAGGFLWKYKSDLPEGKPLHIGTLKVIQWDPITGKKIKNWYSMQKASTALKLTLNKINGACKTGRKAGGFKWTFTS